MQARPDSAPAFWLESWRWAAPAWRREYGAPNGDVDHYAERILFSGWATRFGLPQRWRAPDDARWVALVQAPPAALHAIVAVLGGIAWLRAGAPAPVGYAAAAARWWALAFRYRDVNCMRIRPRTPIDGLPSPQRCGADVLCAMASRAWPDAESRFAMLAEPRNGAGASDAECRLEFDSIDVSRCLSISGAVRRAWPDESTDIHRQE